MNTYLLAADSIGSNIAIGVTSGVIAATLIQGVVAFFRAVIIPYFREVTYRGIDVSGEWHLKDYSLAQQLKLSLEQKQNALTGEASLLSLYEEERPHYEKLRTFNVSGAVNDRFLVLYLENISKGRIGRISFLLEIVGDGRNLNGAFSFYSVIGSIIETKAVDLWCDIHQAEAAYKAQEEKLGYLLGNNLELGKEPQGEEEEESILDIEGDSESERDVAPKSDRAGG